MIDCMILGDSIAVGTAVFKHGCEVYAQGGWNSWQWNKEFLKKDLSANTVIISLGTNDHKGVKTRKELETMREKVKGSRVYWILPAIKPNIQDIVKKVAAHYGDTVLPIQHLQPDGVHPTWSGYKDIATQTRR